VQELRAAGYLPQAIDNYLARLGHTYADNAFMDLDRLAAGFEVARLHHAPARFDESHLKHWQREAVQHATADGLWAWMAPEVDALVPPGARVAFIEAVRANLTVPADARAWARILFSDDLRVSHAAHAAIGAAGGGFFAAARRALETHGTDFKALAATVKQDTGLSGKALFQPLRAALTGELDGPEMVKLLPLIGIERARKRLLEWCENGEKSKE